VTRDYVIDFDRSGPPLLSVYGGKLTTYRKLAEKVVDMLARTLGNASSAWTAVAPLPGGDMPGADFEGFLAQARVRYGWLAPTLLHRYARAYGTRMDRMLAGCSKVTDLGEEVLPGLYAKEVIYLRAAEFARTAQDVLYRRSKLGVHLAADSENILDEWLAQH
jgi:glycerol-3-phosphate dehydrogenase